jgi:hypothetical protein
MTELPDFGEEELHNETATPLLTLLDDRSRQRGMPVGADTPLTLADLRREPTGKPMRMALAECRRTLPKELSATAGRQPACADKGAVTARDLSAGSGRLLKRGCCS